jgi:AP-3 complex subunit beta
MQAVTLAARLIALGIDPEIPFYVLKLADRDQEYDIRDRAHFFLAVLQGEDEVLRAGLKGIFFPPRLPPSWASSEGDKKWQIGSISQWVGREIEGYEGIPEWADEADLPDDAVRAPIKRISGVEMVLDEDESDGGGLSINDFFGDDGEEAEDEEKKPAEQNEEEEEEEPVEEAAEEPEEEEDIDDFFS